MEILGDIAEEIEFQMHEYYPLRRAHLCWISIPMRKREAAELTIRARLKVIPEHDHKALLEARSTQMQRQESGTVLVRPCRF
ncbi:hypothetical protein [Alloyangia pacifica]|uniref:hypothetical protein n=1 Tax=Alloyangia pacifica TaxID=311180 RepID=UPI000B86FB6D|nr:hypothetical protein [Alloyangia pacifica]